MFCCATDSNNDTKKSLVTAILQFLTAEGEAHADADVKETLVIASDCIARAFGVSGAPTPAVTGAGLLDVYRAG